MSLRRRREALGAQLRWLVAALWAAPLSAGTFIDFSQGDPVIVTHPNGYTGSGGEFVVGICLDPTALPASGDPLQALENVAATYNRMEPVLGNVSPSTVLPKIDFESALLHEVGHCIGMDHSALGPSETCDATSDGFDSPSLFYANSFGSDGPYVQACDPDGSNATLPNPPTTVYFADVGADDVRGTRDDARGSNVNRNWFRRNVNNPFELPGSVVDRGTHSVSLTHLPGSHNYAEISTSFSPCDFDDGINNNDPQPDSSSLRNQAPTQNTMFPVLCTSNVIRKLAPDDVTTLRIARAGLNGSQSSSSDNYVPRLEVVPSGPNCDIKVRFLNIGSGFAYCQVGGQLLQADDIGITTAEAVFSRNVNWHFNQEDTTGGSEPPANLSIALTPSTSTAVAGQQVIYTLNLTNAGPATATATSAAFPTPSGLEFVSNSGHCTSAFPCSLGNLASGASRQIVSTWRVAATQAGGSTITSTATISSATPDDVPANDTATHVLNIGAPQADLGIALSDNNAQTAPGGTVTYVAAATNAGPSPANALELVFTRPAGTNAGSVGATGWGCSHQGNGTTVCTRSSLAAGVNSSINFVVHVPIAYAGPTPMVASATLRATTLDPNSGANNTNSASESTPVSLPDPGDIFCSGFEDVACPP